MKKRMAMLLCAFCALVSVAALPAQAAERFYPVRVEEYTYGPLDELRIDKVYQLSLSDDPRGIPTEDFDRNGRHYYLLDMVKADEIGVDTQSYTETITMDSKTGELSAVLKLLEGEMEVTTEDGYSGTLILDHTSVKVEVKGYQTSTRTLSATRTYPSLSDADLSLVPKTVTDGGNTLTLADVQWANDGTYYTATAKYTGTASSRYATGYTVTANYTGKVAKTGCEIVTYTVTFGSTKLEEPEQTSIPTPTPAPEPTPTPTTIPVQELDMEQPTDASRNSLDCLIPMGVVAGVVALMVAVCLGVQKFKERMMRT